MTRAQFSRWFGIPVATLRHWERGDRKPRRAAQLMLNVIASNPRAALTARRRR